MIAPCSAIGSSFRDLLPGGPTKELDDREKQRTADPIRRPPTAAASLGVADPVKAVGYRHRVAEKGKF
jgi:hypothetical protein